MAIRDTCACGASFTSNGIMADHDHRRWLDAHEKCRGVARGELRLDLPAGHPNSVHPRAEDQPTLPARSGGSDAR